jgi:hypothetical protein
MIRRKKPFLKKSNGPVLKKIGPQGRKGWRRIPSDIKTTNSDTLRAKEGSLLWFLKYSDASEAIEDVRMQEKPKEIPLDGIDSLSIAEKSDD